MGSLILETMIFSLALSLLNFIAGFCVACYVLWNIDYSIVSTTGSTTTSATGTAVTTYVYPKPSVAFQLTPGQWRNTPKPIKDFINSGTFLERS
jgi:hypothetical protein